jgi:ankyrin repeat protein
MRMVDSGSVAGAKKLLEMGADPNAVNDLGSCVYYAAKNGNLELVILLHEQAHANLNKVGDALGLTPLGVALNNNHQAVADYLKSKGAALTPDEKDFTPLHTLVVKGDAAAILDSFKRNEKDKFGRSVTHYCAALGKLELLRQMDPKRLDEADRIYQRPPLHYAVIQGHTGVVDWLVSEADCNMRSADKAWQFPLSWASQFGREQIARQLLKVAASKGELPQVLDQVDKYGWRAFHKAAKHNHAELVAMFIREYGIDPNLKTARGIGVVELAKEGNASAVLKILTPASPS